MFVCMGVYKGSTYGYLYTGGLIKYRVYKGSTYVYLYTGGLIKYGGIQGVYLCILIHRGSN